MSTLYTYYIFNVLSVLLVMCSFMVIFSNHAVYSLLYLVSCFLLSSCLLFVLECELLALFFIIIYVGAIAILFLFAIMMVEHKFSDLFFNSTKYFPAGMFFVFCFLIALFIEINVSFPNFVGKSTKTPENSYYSYDHVLAWVPSKIGSWSSFPKKIKHSDFDSSQIPKNPQTSLNEVISQHVPQITFYVPWYLNQKKELKKARYSSEYPIDSFRQQLTYVAFQIAWPVSSYEYFLLHYQELVCQDWTKSADYSSDAQVYSTTLYSEYALALLMLGLILLMVLIGAVHLTNSYRFKNKLPSQLKFKQVAWKAKLIMSK